MTICYKVDAFNGRKKVDSEIVVKSKLNKVVRGFEEDGLTVRKKIISCEEL